MNTSYLILGLVVGFVITFAGGGYAIIKMTEEKNAIQGTALFVLFTVGVFGSIMDAILVFTGTKWF